MIEQINEYLDSRNIPSTQTGQLLSFELKDPAIKVSYNNLTRSYHIQAGLFSKDFQNVKNPMATLFWIMTCHSTLRHLPGEFLGKLLRHSKR